MTRRNPYDRRWRKVRLAVLERDGWRCQIQLPGCLGYANTGDHIIPVDQGGNDHPSNVRAACRPCNIARGNMLRSTSATTPGGGTAPPSRQW